MDKKSLRIVFMGTPDFAVESLRQLVENGYQVAGVVTMPDKAVGRHGSVLQPSPVKQYAEKMGLPILQPEKLKDETFLRELKQLRADLQVVVAFRMLPDVVWDMPKYGTFNLHASLLPQYRGAAPINWAIIHGERETGVTTFFLSHKIDTGRIILQRRLPIAETDDAGIVHDALMRLGASLTIETVDLLLAGNGVIDTTAQETLYQSESELHPAPKLFKDTCRIDWHRPAKKVYDFIRGLSPHPVAWTELQVSENESIPLKIFQSAIYPETHFLEPGIIRTDSKNLLEIAVEDGFIRLLSVQLAGKKRMTSKDFLNGNKHLLQRVK